MADKKPPLIHDTQSALMSDLESIRTLLEDGSESDGSELDGDDKTGHGNTGDDKQDIPVLDDVVPARLSTTPHTPLVEHDKIDKVDKVPKQDRWTTASHAFVAQAKALIQAKGLGDDLSQVQLTLIDSLVDMLKGAIDEEVDHIRAELQARLQGELDYIKSELFKDSD